MFGSPKTIVSDNAGFFTAAALLDCMKMHGIGWSTVLFYAPMSNGRALSDAKRTRRKDSSHDQDRR